MEDTNVLKLVQHLSSHASDRRIVYYDPGVGSPDSAPPTGLVDGLQRQWDRISGLASGTGIYDEVAQGYLFLMRNWTGAQDRIYCFGFSRGAFTARAIAGMVNLFGIVRPENEALLPMLVRIYFSASGKSNKPPSLRTASGHALTLVRVGSAAPCSRLPASEFADDGAVVQIAIAVRDHVGKQAVDQAKERQFQPDASRQRECRARVLDLILGRTARDEVAIDHALTMLAKNGRIRETAQQCFADLRRIGTAALGKQQGFGDRGDRACNHHLIDELRKLARSGRPDANRSSHGLEQGA